jgi:magnesium and cobalt exporter, CNNM family
MLVLPIVVGFLLLLSALLAASETALFALVRMEGTRETLPHPVLHAIDRLMRRPLESLIVLIGLSEVANVFAECLATSFLLFLLGSAGAYASVPLMFVLVLLVADITPKTVALGFPAVVARISARPLAVLTDLVHPVAGLFTAPEGPPRPEGVSETEFKELLRLGERQGQVEPGERELIHRVFDFGNRRVLEVMTPRDRIFALDVDTPPERLVQEVTRGHFSRVPVYRHNPDNIIGILHVKDLVAHRLDVAPPRLERLLRPPYFVPARKPLSELFDEMRRERVQVAPVVDEYGKLQGLVTLEDLLEELFGEIRDEFDFEGPELSHVAENEWLVSGAIDVGRLRETLGNGHLPPPEGGEQTLSTLVLRRLGRVPRAGEKFAFGDFEAEVERVRGATVELVRLRR